MSDQWHIIERKETNNLIINPSFEVNITDGWTSSDSGAGAVFVRATVLTYYGIGSAKITAGNGNCQLISDNFNLDNNATVYAQCISRSSVIGKNDLIIRDTTTPASRATATGTTTGWEKLQATWTNTTGGAVNVALYLRNNAADSATICYFDGVQAEIDTTDYTTYCDGDQPGCIWNGEKHNSTSTRSALSFDGGISKDLGTDLSFWVDREMGVSSPPVQNVFQEYAMTTGAFYNGAKVMGRPFTLGGILEGSSKTDLHDKMKAMLDAFNVYGQDEIILDYDGGTSSKRIKARYESGLQGDYGGDEPLVQRVGVRLFASDPNWYQINDTNDVLDVNDTATLRYIARRKRSTGQWDDMGLTANPTVGGTIYAICAASDGLVYIGGNFTGWDGNADRDYGVIYNPVTDAFSTWGAANDINSQIRDILEGPDGTIYVCGSFSNLGDANGDGITSWTGSAWASIGAPAASSYCMKMAIDSNGYLHVVGGFENGAGDADFDGYMYWDGTNWNTHGLPAVTGTDYLADIVIDVDDNIYVAGDASTIGGVTNNYIAMWNGSAWVDVGEALSALCRALELHEDGKSVYIGGDFVNAGNSNGDFLVLWNGLQFLNLGTGPGAAVYGLKRAPNNDLWVTGTFSFAAGDDFQGITIWNGATYTGPDMVINVGIVNTIAFANIDPMTNDNFDVYAGWVITGTMQIAGVATVNNPGNANAYPIFKIKRSGGTSATLYQIRNETTGKTLHMKPLILDGDTITIELSPEGAEVTSEFPGWENYRYAILPNSDDTEFVLIPGDNLITAFVYGVGAPTMTANCLHKAVFTGYDD